jgi:hypothetical protein
VEVLVDVERLPLLGMNASRQRTVTINVGRPDHQTHILELELDSGYEVRLLIYVYRRAKVLHIHVNTINICSYKRTHIRVKYLLLLSGYEVRLIIYVHRLPVR